MWQNLLKTIHSSKISDFLTDRFFLLGNGLRKDSIICLRQDIVFRDEGLAQHGGGGLFTHRAADAIYWDYTNKLHEQSIS